MERSGVGDAKLLRSLDIKVVSDLPGVGEQYQDHYTTLSIYRVSNDSWTADDFLRGDKETQAKIFAEWEVWNLLVVVSGSLLSITLGQPR